MGIDLHLTWSVRADEVRLGIIREDVWSHVYGGEKQYYGDSDAGGAE